MGERPTRDQLFADPPRWDTLVANLRQVVREETGQDKPIAITEFNSSWSGTMGGETGMDTLNNALWLGDVLGRLIRARVEMAAYFSLQSNANIGGYGLFERDKARPTYYTYQMFRGFGDTLVFAQSDTPRLSIYAATTNDALNLVIINLNDQPISRPLVLDHFAIGGPAQVRLFDADHKATAQEDVTVTGQSDYTVPPLSITRLTIPGKVDRTAAVPRPESQPGQGARATEAPMPETEGHAMRGWKLIWSDEFDGPAGALPDGTKWGYEIGGGGWGNAELQYYTDRPENAALDGAGALVITAKTEDPATTPYRCLYGACMYSSARLFTRGKFEFTYGRVEARIKIPSGQGIWPAFWMLGSNIGTKPWPSCGEIDIMENIGKEPTTIHGTIHGPGYAGSAGLSHVYTQTVPFADDYHTYAIEWEPERIAWYVDGNLYYFDSAQYKGVKTPADLEQGRQWVFDHPFYLLLNVAVGGQWPGLPDATTRFPQTMLVDYVRVYARTDEARDLRQAEERAADLLARMTLAEKIGQMTQVEKNSIRPDDVYARGIGSVLSGGGGYPLPNTPEGWLQMTNAYTSTPLSTSQAAALRTRLGIPIIYGVDAVHGHNNLVGATIFPHQVGLGAADDPDLVRRIGRATAEEVAATGVHWNFAPVVAVPQDIRWGRAYEAYGEDPELVSRLAVAYLKGLQEDKPVENPRQGVVLATPKHYLADGGTAFGSAKGEAGGVKFLLDQGEARIDEATLRRIHLAPYRAAVDAGALSIMASHSSWQGVKMHAQKYLLTDLLKGELGFRGFIVSDWQAVDQIPGGYDNAVATAINAGIDMVMVPYDYDRFIETLTRAVERGAVPMARIDDAVRRILTVKFWLGLFEHPLADASAFATIGSPEHRELAREAVRKSLVLLKNEGQTLPLAKGAGTILVAGRAADDIGIQCGGWTIEWQGEAGAITPGTTILEGIRQVAGPGARVEFDPAGQFAGRPRAEIGIAVVGELPYAEWVGDRADLSLSAEDVAVIERLREHSQRLIVVLISGRPLIITDTSTPLSTSTSTPLSTSTSTPLSTSTSTPLSTSTSTPLSTGLLPLADAVVAAWLPGTEGAGVADVLFGDFPFTGKLSYTWPRAMAQLPFDLSNLPTDGPAAPLFPRGYGLR
jgi:beta-glucosidase